MAERWVWVSSPSNLLLFFLFNMAALNYAQAKVPAIFILGDSTADVGTNNYIETGARANFPHNGIDFPNSIATGRFSNGLNTADYLAKRLLFRHSPPAFLALLNKTKTANLRKNILRGVNFASGGSGILDNTGKPFGDVVTLYEQIQQFTTVRSNLTNLLGSVATDSYLSKSLFFISTGSNDIFEYLPSTNSPNMKDFITSLKCKYEKHLTNLYSLGARRFGIVSTPNIGCCPSQRVQNATGGCFEVMNDYSRAFYLETQSMLESLSSKLEGMKYSLANAARMVENLMNSPHYFGFTDVTTPCCGDGVNACSPSAKLCNERDEYLFWDMNHPTQRAANLAALTLYGGGSEFVTPINFRQLADN